jgi:hypothetical protein
MIERALARLQYCLVAIRWNMPGSQTTRSWHRAHSGHQLVHRNINAPARPPVVQLAPLNLENAAGRILQIANCKFQIEQQQQQQQQKKKKCKLHNSNPRTVPLPLAPFNRQSPIVNRQSCATGAVQFAICNLQSAICNASPDAFSRLDCAKSPYRSLCPMCTLV